MAATFPQGANTYVPSHEASGSLVVDFSRNPSTFKLAEWAQYVPVDKQVGYYLEMTVEEAARVLESDGDNYNWPDGATAPEGNDGTESFQWKLVQTKRRAYAYNVGYLASQQASWDVLAHNGRIYAQKAMTIRSAWAIAQAVTAGNYDASHTSAVSSITGVTGKWDVSTTARMDIKRSIDHAVDTIRKDTLGVVNNQSDLVLVLSPGCARKISVSQEIVDFVKQSPHSRDYIEGKLGPNAAYNLPEYYSGVRIVIEDAVKVTSRKGATKATSYLLADATPFICARPGGLVGVAGAPSFSTHTVFIKEELTVESKDDPDNRRTKGRVVDDVQPVVTAPVSGFLFTAAVD